MVASWFLGDMAGHAITDMLTGRFNPTGQPADPDEPFPSKYIDLPVEPLFPFGYGLSYAKVSLRNFCAAQKEFYRQDQIDLKIDVINESGIATEETIFLFAHDLASSSGRPLLELKSWAKVALASRETRTVALATPAEWLCGLYENFELCWGPANLIFWSA